MTSPLIDPAHIDELEWPALRPGGADVPAIDDTDAVGPRRRDLAAAEAERDAAQADLRERVLRAGGYAIQLAEAEAHIKALHAKLDALAPHGSCGCSYDTPGQVCLHHSPQLVAALARAVKAEADLKTLNETWVAALSGLVERAATAEAERDALRLAIAGQPMDPILKNGSSVEMACTTREAQAYAKANHAAAEAEVARLAGLLGEAREVIAQLIGWSAPRWTPDGSQQSLTAILDTARARARAFLTRLKEPTDAK